jgi:acyl-CoA synthetase (AMP-forming)/AMP-acid ligase II
LPAIEYPASDRVLRVRSTGIVTFGGQTWQIGRAFAGLPVGLRPSAQADGKWEVFFCHHPLGQLDLATPRLGKHQLRSIYASPATDLRVLDLDGTILPEESLGEIAVRGPGVMKGYYRQPGETSQAVDEDGFFLTGDLGIVDDDGYVHIVGRRKELIIRGGFNVYPREVEDRINAHPAIQDVAVVGLPHEVLGEVVCACIVPVEGAIVTGAEVKEWCRVALADYKVPDLVRFLDSFPLTGSGKIRRVELARMITAEESSRRA